MTHRRDFIRQSAALLGGLALHPTAEAAYGPLARLQARPGSKEGEGTFWRHVRAAFASSPTLINLNNGGVCPSPRAAMEALDHYNRMCNEAPSYYMWRILDQDREPLRRNLARIAGVPHDELAIVRNATEALNTIIFGLRLAKGDEVVVATCDYPNMANAWKQRALRDGVKLVYADPKLPGDDEEAMAQAYIKCFTPRTKVVHITHIVNWNGQIMPVRRIADEAHKRGIEVLVDGAHAFALLDHSIADLGCDYWGTSLHKWLCAPFGTGMLWIRKEKVARVWPLLSNDKPESDDIRKFESLGTRSFPIEMATGYAIDLHETIGARRKQERLQQMRMYWTDAVRDVKDLRFETHPDPQYGCAIGTFGIKGKKATWIADKLFERWKVHTVAIEREGIPGIEAPYDHVRVTPNVYTSFEDLDRLVEGIRDVAKG
ncbi:MAG: aminotransferase class V-fold PLP-dependent enzyme [Flavobacteriales bacterium]|nr:aminotransferase class V-fold PLP-dependent enzyme [Flavobacteriales bacterium]